MHAAPPVRVTLGRSPGWVLFQGLVAAAAVGNLAAWGLLLLGASAWPAWLPALLAGGAAAAAAWRAPLPGVLDWDGRLWRLGENEGDVAVTIDLDAWLLLRFTPLDGRARWLAASRSRTQGPWAAWRAALHAWRASPAAAEPTR